MTFPNVSGHCYCFQHYHDVTMDSIASQITSLTIVYSAVYSAADQRKHQSSASLAFVRGIHRGPVNSPHKGPVTRKMFPFDDVIMKLYTGTGYTHTWLYKRCESITWSTGYIFVINVLTLCISWNISIATWAGKSNAVKFHVFITDTLNLKKHWAYGTLYKHVPVSIEVFIS